MREILVGQIVVYLIGLASGIGIGMIIGLLDKQGARDDAPPLDVDAPRKPRWARTLADDEAIVAAAIAALPEADR